MPLSTRRRSSRVHTSQEDLQVDWLERKRSTPSDASIGKLVARLDGEPRRPHSPQHGGERAQGEERADGEDAVEREHGGWSAPRLSSCA